MMETALHTLAPEALLADFAEARLRVMGVEILDVGLEDAARILESFIRDRTCAHCVYFVNTHTLNLAYEDADYLNVLRSADAVFGDGTGVRWAARALAGVRLKDNVNGTDLIPRLFEAWAGRGYRYYLLGATPDAIERAAAHAQARFQGWELAGHHHGYLDSLDQRDLIARINASGADMLLVGMGNPKQEQWLHLQRRGLEVPLCIGVGGLFTYWSGDLTRAPSWVRHLGHEWLHLLVKQPQKFRRYILGNPRFLLRVARTALQSRLHARGER
jgi:N-acetylglucosaminyldiphosphoundecaprenol N-acetyl-beta-D-mannosaminyltransferase